MKEKKPILITGASRGIGYEIARKLLEMGYQVIATARNSKGLPEKLPGENISFYDLDVTSPESASVLAKRLSKSDSLPGVIVNNAGIYTGTASEIMAVNYFGIKTITHTVRKEAAKLRIVNISSGMGELSGFSPMAQEHLLAESLTEGELDGLVKNYIENKLKGWPSNAYSASKAMLNTLTRIWHRNLPALDVVSVCPGWVRTDMGGSTAPRSVEQGAETPIWAATTDHLAGGGFYRDKKQIGW